MLKSHKRRPVKIDVFVDGSWLFKGKLNPSQAGGWGAVVIETYKNGAEEIWMPSGGTDETVHSSNGAEIFAAISGLRAVQIREEHRAGEAKVKPIIVLHTDQDSWPKFVEKYRTDPNHGMKEGQSTPLRDMAQLLQELGATVEYKSHNKATSRYAKGKPSDDIAMEIPHQLASRHAWRARMDNQDGVLHFGPDKISANTPEERESLINRLFPIKTEKLFNRDR